MMFSDSDKTAILLNLLDRQIDEIQKREQAEQKLFEWATSLLLAAFAGVVALSQKSTPIPQAVLVKLLATAMISVPIYTYCDTDNESIKSLYGKCRSCGTHTRLTARI